MHAKELLHQINNARQMLLTAAEECDKPNPDLSIILDNVSRSQELILEAEFNCSNEITKRKDDKLHEDLNAALDGFEKLGMLFKQGD